MNVQQTLEQRASTHGSFHGNAECSQFFKRTVKTYCNQQLTAVQQEALDNICQKLARIITGNANHADSWHDIAGYATLAEQDIQDANS